MTEGATPVFVWCAPGVCGAGVLLRSLARAFDGAPAVVADGLPAAPPDSSLLFLLAGGLPSDLARVGERRRALAGLVPEDRIIRVLVASDGVSETEARAALGSALAVWPSDARAVLSADRTNAALQDVAPRSRLLAALDETVRGLRARLSAVPARLDLDAAARAVSERVWAAAERGHAPDIGAVIDRELGGFLSASAATVSLTERDGLRRQLRQELIGLGPIEPYFDDPAVSEIMVNGAGNIYVERHGRVERAPAVYASEERLRLAISRIVGPAGRRVDASSPLCDVRLPDGSRANVVLPPVSVAGPVLTVRRFRPAFSTLADLIAAEALSKVQADRLGRAVTERRNILIAGNSGAGKTTLLNALSALIPDDERIITLEDAAELRLAKPHVVRLETRPPNAEGQGEITMRDLVVNALRMRPDRLIVGECRGPEAVPMLQAMNTGHDGSMTTLHANSAGEALSRLESMALMGAAHWPSEVVRRQIAAAIHLIVYVRRAGARRRVESIAAAEEFRP